MNEFEYGVLLSVNHAEEDFERMEYPPDACDVCKEYRWDLHEMEDHDPQTGTRWWVLVCDGCLDRKGR